MNIIQQPDENLPDEFINENISMPSIKESTRLTKNMSANPFKRKSTGIPLVKALSCPVQKLNGYVTNSKERSTCQKIDESSDSFIKDNLHTGRSLKEDIKGLLQRAIQIRNSQNYFSEKQIGCEGIHVEPKSSSFSFNKCVTMEDIFAP
ncbi:unnamed protein product [Moneuplotes crassus]|uniref:Uncharacterized protein n=1 Tax=Euplotes crassus TaxID=5936 RepID=A0AAD1U332_EUPCR|nr:unnamed protein product [Moneuplotes crassus]